MYILIFNSEIDYYCYVFGVAVKLLYNLLYTGEEKVNGKKITKHLRGKTKKTEICISILKLLNEV